jgi:hypothetical protein
MQAFEIFSAHLVRSTQAFNHHPATQYPLPTGPLLATSQNDVKIRKLPHHKYVGLYHFYPSTLLGNRSTSLSKLQYYMSYAE